MNADKMKIFATPIHVRVLKSTALLGTALLLLLSFQSVAFGAFAPLSPEFLNYATRQPETRKAAGTAPSFSSGYAPSPVDLRHLGHADYSVFLAAAAALPSRFDLRDDGAVTGVKSQLPYGTCWAFASIGSLESSYLKRKGTVLDLSELHLAWFTYKNTPGFTLSKTAGVEDTPLENGGSSLRAIATLAAWHGAVEESVLPYPAGTAATPGYSVPGQAGDYAARLHLQNAYFVQKGGYEKTPAKVIKTLLMTEGASYVSFSWNDETLQEVHHPYWNADKAAYYYNGDGYPNHAVLLVGWDDSYSRENFREGNRPQNDGAWLVRNSWGSGWGDKGYCWISYEDKAFDGGVVLIADDAGNYSEIYQHDELGWCNSFGDDETEWMANVYRARGDEQLKAVGLYTTAANALFEIRVYTRLSDPENPSSGTLSLVQTGSEVFAGYHTITLDRPVDLDSETAFALVVKMTTPNHSTPLAVEARVLFYSEKAVCNPGESFWSWDEGATWDDFGDAGNGNFCIKAFTAARGTLTVQESDEKSGSSGCNTGWALVVAVLPLSGCLRRYVRRIPQSL